jgi:hypothetical protein
MVNVDHEPDSAWDCRGCGKDWPCDEAREQLLVEYAATPVVLGEFMATKLGEAASVLYAEPIDVLFDRFIGWTKPKTLDAL